MKGVVFNIFESFISENFGDEAYESLLDMCPLHSGGVFVGPDTYPDSDLFALVTKACEVHQIPVEDALRLFGHYMFGQLAAKYPVFLEKHETLKSFLLSVHDVIHVEVRKLYKEAETPSFTYHDVEGDGLVIEYTSKRKLCYLMEGLLNGAAEHFGIGIDMQQETCMHLGDAHCRFALQFVAQKAA